MAFGAGAPVAALTFSLIDDAFGLVQDTVPVIASFVFGGISYSLANRIIYKKNAGLKNRKRSSGEDSGGGKNASGLALMLGSPMDNILENMALGISIATGGAVNIVLIAANIISNFPEGLALTQGMRSHGRSNRQILLI
ncbi:MAG TPA: hypothetical protein VHA09_06045 [Nitrososphaera sp.]|nr:hypothetical protein [Nitrososphaera sp.]